jgi:ABC-type sugar transport system permease subunit
MSFLASKASAMPVVIFVHSWTGVPLMMMSTLAGLQTIPQSLGLCLPTACRTCLLPCGSW